MANATQRDVALGRPEGWSDYLDTSSTENARHNSNMQMRGPICAVCGSPVTRLSRGRPRLQHPECTRFRMYLNAAAREARMITFSDTEAARVARRLTLVLANSLPVRWQRKRDEHGRFLPREGSGS